jgi:hypothetical protein
LKALKKSILNIKFQTAINEIILAAQNPLCREVIETWLSDYKELWEELLAEMQGQVSTEKIHGSPICEFERIYMHLDILLDCYLLETLCDAAMNEYHSLNKGKNFLKQWVRKYEKLGLENLFEPPLEDDSINNFINIYGITFVDPGIEFKKCVEFYHVFNHLYWKAKINYSFDIETSSIIEEVESVWRNFIRRDLIKLRDSLEDILQKEKIDEIIINYNEQPSYFNKILNIDIPNESNKIENPESFPIPNFFLGNTKIADTIVILETCVEYVLKPDHKYFNLFFTYRLATLSPENIEPFLRFQLEKSFEQDNIGFKLRLDYVLSIYASILGERKNALKNLIDSFFSTASLIINIDDSELSTLSIASKRPILFNNDSLKDIFDSRAINFFIDIEEKLMSDGFFDEESKWQRDIIMLVSFILVLEDRKYFKPSRKDVKIRRISYRIFFEKRYRIILKKQMQQKQIELYDLPEKHKYIFDFIPPNL